MDKRQSQSSVPTNEMYRMHHSGKSLIENYSIAIHFTLMKLEKCVENL